jgi:hypothetical protein
LLLHRLVLGARDGGRPYNQACSDERESAFHRVFPPFNFKAPAAQYHARARF